MNNMESWKSIPGYEGRYDVSSVGRIRSLSRTLNVGRSWPGRILNPHRRGGRYFYVMLGKDGTRNDFAVHHLVLLAFVGPRPEGMQGCHFDGDSANNSVENLRWDTSKGNHQDRIRHGRTGTLWGERHHSTKLSNDSVRCIRQMVSSGAIQRRVAEQFGVHPATICEIMKGKKRAHVV
jgi:hypothetical protein